MKKWMLLAFIVSHQAVALSPCSPDSRVGSWCEVRLEKLHPTQPGIGQLQVDVDQTKLAKKGKDKLDSFLEKKEIPVVISPKGDYWLVDRHHLTKALWQQGVKKARVRIIARLQDNANFWQQMEENHWVWLYNERGLPVTPEQLPSHVGDLPDYPYRSLAGFLQDEGYFEKHEQVYFVEFAWASWLGKKMGWLPVNADNLTERLEQAKILACSSEAKSLPGYPGKMCQSLAK
ncbi:ParB-like protein [Serratia sp. UGAL515B_01]|uniref:ParB-like protein n=1 Tax=Serratia sp. UGAL515B_01 TaxID=2986763 RepID=UPI0029540D7E|nr:ParB-like protein [Serratia sp. UGAL515B_01]WON78524.1 hypothetical protein OK023_07800 [Serratia sp. UGAL515B_01]